MPANSKLKSGQLSSGLLRNCSTVTSNRIFSFCFFPTDGQEYHIESHDLNDQLYGECGWIHLDLESCLFTPKGNAATGSGQRAPLSSLETWLGCYKFFSRTKPHLGPWGKSRTHRHITEVMSSLKSKGYFIQFDFGGHGDDGCRGGTKRRIKIALCFFGAFFLLAISQIRLGGHANLLYSILCHHVVYIYRAIGVSQQP